MKDTTAHRIEILLSRGDSENIDKAIPLVKRSDLDGALLLDFLEKTRYARMVVALLSKIFDQFDEDFVSHNISLIHSRIMALLENQILPEDEIKLNCIALIYDKDEYDEQEIVLLDKCISKYKEILERYNDRITAHLENHFLSYNGMSYVDLCDLLLDAVKEDEFLMLLLTKAAKESDDQKRNYYLSTVELFYLHGFSDSNPIPLWLEKSLDEYLSTTMSNKCAQQALLKRLSNWPNSITKHYFSRLYQKNNFGLSKIKMGYFLMLARLKIQKLHDKTY